MTRKAADKICNWIQIIGLMGFAFLFMFCFFGKEDDYLEKVAFFGMVAGIVAYVLSLLVSSDLKGVAILFLLLGGICIGTNVFLAAKGYGTGEASDCGAYTFQAARYWQETRTTRVRHRTTSTMSIMWSIRQFWTTGKQLHTRIRHLPLGRPWSW